MTTAVPHYLLRAAEHPWPTATSPRRLCADTASDPRLFDESLPFGFEAPRSLCRTCPSRAECALTAAVRRESGVWGGRLFDQGDDITDSHAARRQQVAMS